ncbi:MAG TPA: hypothetical protein P5234_00030 [Thermoanaerobaculaceae bacterium]|nr:hypothetical protein [Thermoanaerobaculaceae bacterium]HRS14616.1 hypothetical protein [Thermoanaerobaculaceae bacterium]
MRKSLHLSFVMILLAIGPAIVAQAQERYCNGRPRVLRGVKMYPNGRPIQMGELVLFPNGTPTMEEDGSLLYPSGAPLFKTKLTRNERPRALYPNGNTLALDGTSYYPNGKILFQKGVFYDQKARPSLTGPDEVVALWKGYHYTFQVRDGVPSQERIRIKALELGVVTTFTLEKGMITDVDAVCPAEKTPAPTP